MWLNAALVTEQAIAGYRKTLAETCPNHLVIDGLFDPAKLQQVCQVLRQEQAWRSQKHSYSALYVSETKWQITPPSQRFVQRDVWQRQASDERCTVALDFLTFLRSREFMALLSAMFSVAITDLNLANPALNTNYFRLGARDFINLHADDSPGREVCMLLYLNEDWQPGQGGELVFAAKPGQPLQLAPLFNRCVLFDPSSAGSEHWVNPLLAAKNELWRYNVTSWYWRE